MRALFPFTRLAARLAEQFRFQRMKRRVQTAPDLLQVGLAQPPATITSDFTKVVAGAQSGADGGRWIGRPSAEHDRVPGIAFEPVGLAILLVSLGANPSRLLHLLIVEAARATQFPRLRLTVAARQRNLNHSWHASSEHFGPDVNSPQI
jgi:hypothetical protein